MPATTKEKGRTQMNPLAELAKGGQTLLLDGAMGTMLFDVGLAQGESPELWNITHSEQVRDVHRGYIEAGAQLILTNTFGGNRLRLELHKLQDRAPELNRAAAELARAEADAAVRRVLVAGSMGPTGSLLEPMGPMVPEQARSVFAEQAGALAEGGVDLLWIETMSDLEEVQAAVAGAREATDLPTVVTMTFDTHGHTMMGVSPERASEALSELGLAAFGANCGNGPSEIEAAISAMHDHNPDHLLVAKSNAGIPKLEKGEIIYDGTPEVMAEYAAKARDLGANLIGACCGSTPAHLRAMAEALEDPT